MISPSHGPDDHDFEADFGAVTDAAAHVDGYAPLNEQATLDLRAGRRTPLLLRDGDVTVLNLTADRSGHRMTFPNRR